MNKNKHLRKMHILLYLLQKGMVLQKFERLIWSRRVILSDVIGGLLYREERLVVLCGDYIPKNRVRTTRLGASVLQLQRFPRR